MSEAPSYDCDYLSWLDEQVLHLRAGDFARLDREHLLEELEAMSRSERRQLRNRLIVLVMHLLKLRHQPERQSRSWTVTVITQRVDIELLLKESPSLRPTLQAVLDDIYPQARQETAKETGIDLSRLPSACPFSLTEILAEDFWPEAEGLPSHGE